MSAVPKRAIDWQIRAESSGRTLKAPSEAREMSALARCSTTPVGSLGQSRPGLEQDRRPIVTATSFQEPRRDRGSALQSFRFWANSGTDPSPGPTRHWMHIRAWTVSGGRILLADQAPPGHYLG